MLPPSLSLRFILAIKGLLWFHTNFSIVCSASMKNVIGIFIEVALDL